MFRKPVNKRSSAASFRKDVSRTSKKNFMISRGGYRL